MYLKYILSVLSFNIIYTNCAVFLWSNNHFRVNPLENFDNKKLSDLLIQLDYPEVKIYKSPEQIPVKLKGLVDGYYSAYNTNGKIHSPNITVLSGNPQEDYLSIQNDLNNLKHNPNFLSLIYVIQKLKRKRDVTDEQEPEEDFKEEPKEESKNEPKEEPKIEPKEEPKIEPKEEPKIEPKEEPQEEEEEENYLGTTTTTISSMEKVNYQLPSGPVFYKGKAIKGDTYGIMYCLQPLKLTIEDKVLFLGNTSPDMVTVDTVSRDSFTRLNVNIVVENGKIFLRFIFTWLNDYWYLHSVKISDANNLSYNLTTNRDIHAARQFSYHCTGDTVFSDANKTVFLTLSNMQVQIDSRDGTFDDAYDCVHFTTIPIWSGVLVSVSLITVLFISLIALEEIKTMDKFDNQKTKQLTITVNE